MFKQIFTVIGNCFNGIYELLQTGEGVISLLALGAVTYLGMHKDVGDVAFASVTTLIPSLAIWTKHKIAIANIGQPGSGDLPPKGQA